MFEERIVDGDGRHRCSMPSEGCAAQNALLLLRSCAKQHVESCARPREQGHRKQLVFGQAHHRCATVSQAADDDRPNRSHRHPHPRGQWSWSKWSPPVRQHVDSLAGARKCSFPVVFDTRHQGRGKWHIVKVVCDLLTVLQCPPEKLDGGLAALGSFGSFRHQHEHRRRNRIIIRPWGVRHDKMEVLR